MVVVMICDAYFHGLQYQENLLNEFFKRKGCNVTIIASVFDNIFDYYNDKYSRNASVSDTVIDGTRILKLPFQYNILNKLRKLSGVYKVLNDVSPDIIYVHDIHLNIIDAVRYKRSHPNCKIIMDYHADYSNSAKNWLSLNILHRLIRNYFLKRAKRYIDKIYYVVPASGVFLNEVYNVSYNEMRLLPLGVNMDLCNKVKAGGYGKTIRQELKIPTNAKVVFTGGKITPLKNTHLLVEAINLINDPNVHLIVVGGFDKSNNTYEALIRAKADSNPNIHFTGWVDGERVYEYMDACDIGVFPSSQSVLWQQALSMSLPLVIGEEYRNHSGKVFCHDVDYLNGRNNIFIIRKGELSADKLAEGINYYLKNKDIDQLKNNAKLVAEEMLDYNKIVDDILTF